METFRKYGGWHKPEKITELERRRRRIISVLLRALEARGFEIEADRDYRQFIWVRHQRDRVGFSVTEKIKQVRRELTPEEKKEHWNANSRWKQSSEPTGLLLLRISSEFRRSYGAIDFLETAENPLEDRLNEVVIGFIQKIWDVKKTRLEREEADRRYWKRREEQEDQEKLLQEEQGRKTALENKAAQWKKAQDIKAYVQAVLRLKLSENIMKWLGQKFCTPKL